MLCSFELVKKFGVAQIRFLICENLCQSVAKPYRTAPRSEVA